MSVKTKKVLSRIKKKKILFLWEKVIFAFVGNYFHGKQFSRAHQTLKSLETSSFLETKKSLITLVTIYMLETKKSCKKSINLK